MTVAALLTAVAPASAADIPTEAEVSAALESTPGSNYFWTGRTGGCASEDDSVKGLAERIASERGGKTLEMRLREAGINMPSFDAPDPAKEIWRFASREYAKKTSYQAWVIKGSCVREGNTWEEKELPNLKASGKMRCIWEIDASNFRQEKLIWNDWWWGDWCARIVHIRNTAAMACIAQEGTHWDGGWMKEPSAISHAHNGVYVGGFKFEPDIDPANPEMVAFKYSIEPLDHFPEKRDWEWYLAHYNYMVAHFHRLGDPKPYEISIYEYRWPGGGYWRHEPYSDICSTGRVEADTEAEGSNLRVMPLGDSITSGVGSSNGTGYRAPLWEDLHTVAKTLNFVGPERDNVMSDPDHEGHPGFKISQIAAEAKCSVRAERPNVVLLLAGTNDINKDDDLANAPNRLGHLVDQVLSDAPEATVLVATLTPATGSKAYLQPLIDQYNDQLPRVVKERVALGKHVALVDMSEVTPADLAEPAHPGDGGYRKMANAWYMEMAAAAEAGWIRDPVSGTGEGCAGVEEPAPAVPSAAGAGWLALGTIASGMESPTGRTDLVELDGDRRADYLKISDTLGTVRAALNKSSDVPGQPDWVELPYRNSGSLSDKFADIDGDGRDDMIHTEDGGIGWVRNLGPIPDGMNWQATAYKFGLPTGVSDDSVRFADIDGDGRDDYLRVGSAGAIHAYVNLTTGWEEHLNWAPGVSGGSKNALRLADVNNDRKADYLMVSSDGSVDAYINNWDRANPTAPGRFTKKENFVGPTGYPADKSTFRDISGDGKADYVVIYDGGAIRCWLNKDGNL
ncbi:GDSL-type esterase/lipase family protein [Streptomyces sp. SD15]